MSQKLIDRIVEPTWGAAASSHRWDGASVVDGVSIGERSEIDRVELISDDLPAPVVVTARRPHYGRIGGRFIVRPVSLASDSAQRQAHWDDGWLLELDLWQGCGLVLPTERAVRRYEAAGGMGPGADPSVPTNLGAWQTVPAFGCDVFRGAIALDGGTAGLDFQILGRMHHSDANVNPDTGTRGADEYQIFPEVPGTVQSVAAGEVFPFAGSAIAADEIRIVTTRTGTDRDTQELRSWIEVRDR